MNPYGMWHEWFVQPGQRCLIPITAFAEAVGESPNMTRTWIRVADQPIAACAGFSRPTDEWGDSRSEPAMSELQSLMRISYAVLCLNTQNQPSQKVATDTNYSPTA